MSRKTNTRDVGTKQFDPDRCPYKQLKEHDGLAIVYVIYDLGGYLADRIRITSPDLMQSYCGKKGHVLYDSLEGFGRSCFSYRRGGNNIPYSYETAIDKMQDFDVVYQLIISHIEFH